MQPIIPKKNKFQLLSSEEISKLSEYDKDQYYQTRSTIYDRETLDAIDEQNEEDRITEEIENEYYLYSEDSTVDDY